LANATFSRSQKSHKERTLCTYIISLLVPGCDNVALVGNGFCNDETNNANCHYDGGDCCVVNANLNSCSECVCHLIETCAAGYHPLVGNGFCNDDTNIAECDYDGGDCCGCVITEQCEDCACLGNINSDEVTHPIVGDGICNDETNNAECSYDGGDCCPNPNMVGDATCHDETNHLGCNYDGGDCCVNVNTDSCSDCNCLGGGEITSPGFPGNYDNDLDLIWLIQVQMGQTIEINFLSFDVGTYG
jgi:hypothetical protein